MFPIAEHAFSELISLPMYPELTCDLQDRVLSTLVQVIREDAQ